MRVLVSGGAGFIGSHTVVELLNAGHTVIVFDNFSNSNHNVLNRLFEITGKNVKFYLADLLDPDALCKIFEVEDIDAVIHFAGLKAVGESVEKPLLYYQNNVSGTINLLSAMEKYNVKQLVFSSSATVYGIPERVPIDENAPLSAINPYGQTKLTIENILRDVCAADPALSVALLRYFNPVGAHESGKIGEDPNGIPNNLMPYIARVAAGTLPKLSIFGNDYPTKDGTGVRDYIHVCDLARGHILALDFISQNTGIDAYNLGTGQGYSVLEMVHAFESANGVSVPYVIAPRRAGDAAEVYANTAYAEEKLGFRATRGLFEMCRDSWNFAKDSSAR